MANNRVTRGKALIGNGSLTIVAEATVTWDPAGLADGAGETKAVAVTGAALGDFVIAAPPLDLQEHVYSAYVQSAGTVEIRIQNETGGSVNLGSGVWKVKVLR